MFDMIKLMLLNIAFLFFTICTIYLLSKFLLEMNLFIENMKLDEEKYIYGQYKPKFPIICLLLLIISVFILIKLYTILDLTIIKCIFTIPISFWFGLVIWNIPPISYTWENYPDFPFVQLIILIIHVLVYNLIF